MPISGPYKRGDYHIDKNRMIIDGIDYVLVRLNIKICVVIADDSNVRLLIMILGVSQCTVLVLCLQ